MEIQIDTLVVEIAAFATCKYKCKADENRCEACRSRHRYTAFAYNQPWPSLAVVPPPLFASLFLKKKRDIPVSYHFVLMGYQATIVHLNMIATPLVPITDKRKRHLQQMPIRERFETFWNPVNRAYYAALKDAYTKDRAALLQVQERAIFSGQIGLAFANKGDVPDVAEYVSRAVEAYGTKELSPWPGPVKPLLVEEIADFAENQAVWRARSQALDDEDEVCDAMKNLTV